MSQQPPLITILTTAYNHERYLKQCLDSIVAQTERRWEQIVIDDGSDDGTNAIAQGFEDPRIRCVRQENAGIYRLARTLNQALAVSRGEFVALVSGDDFWPVDKLELQLPAFADADVVLSWGHAAVVDRDGNVAGLVPSKRVVRRSRGRTRGETFSSLLERNMIYAPTVMIRRDALLEIGGFQQPDGVPIEDWPTWLELCKHGRFVATEAVLGYYRRHETQVTAVMREEMARITGWLAAYADQMSPAECRELGIRDSELRSIVERQGAVESYARAKQALADGKREEAEILLSKAVREGSPGLRLRALIALVLGRFGVDAGGVMGMIGRLRKSSVLDRAGASSEPRWRRSR